MSTYLANEINKFIKPGLNIVIELDDEVEYVIDEKALAQIKVGQTLIDLIRVVDRDTVQISAKRIGWSLNNGGAIDYLKAK